MVPCRTRYPDDRGVVLVEGQGMSFRPNVVLKYFAQGRGDIDIGCRLQVLVPGMPCLLRGRGHLQMALRCLRQFLRCTSFPIQVTPWSPRPTALARAMRPREHLLQAGRVFDALCSLHLGVRRNRWLL